MCSVNGYVMCAFYFVLCVDLCVMCALDFVFHVFR